MVSLSFLTQLFQSVILSMSAMDLDFIDPEVEAQMDERQMEEEDEITIQGARGWKGFDKGWLAITKLKPLSLFISLF